MLFCNGRTLQLAGVILSIYKDFLYRPVELMWSIWASGPLKYLSQSAAHHYYAIYISGFMVGISLMVSFVYRYASIASNRISDIIQSWTGAKLAAGFGKLETGIRENDASVKM